MSKELEQCASPIPWFFFPHRSLKCTFSRLRLCDFTACVVVPPPCRVNNEFREMQVGRVGVVRLQEANSFKMSLNWCLIHQQLPVLVKSRESVCWTRRRNQFCSFLYSLAENHLLHSRTKGGFSERIKRFDRSLCLRRGFG